MKRINDCGARRRQARMAAAFAALVLGLPASLSALDVAKSEIESVGGQKVEFVNYEGPQSVVQSAAEIRGIGGTLAAAIGKPGAGPGRAGDLDRYAVIRAVDASVAEGLDADIIVIGKAAVVDHIDNVRRVVAGYLEGAWGYSRADAATLAVFITVYNAVHRGDLAFFGAKYKTVVTKELSAENAGIAKKWDEWPGKTRIVIPLSSGAKPGAAGAVSTGTISGKEVTDSMKSEPQGGIPDRQALVDIKQKEVAQGQADAAAAATAAADAAAKAAAAQAQLQQAQKDLAAAQQAAPAPQAGTAPATAGAAPTAAPAVAPAAAGPTATAPAVAGQPQGGTAAPASQPTAAGSPGATSPTAGTAAAQPAATPAAGQGQQTTATTPEVAAAQQKVTDAQKAADAAQADAAAKQAAAQKADAAVAAKQAEVAADRQSIAQDQNAAIASQVAQANAQDAAGILLLEIVDAGYPFARIDFVDAKTGKLIRASTLNTIRSRSAVDAGSTLVAVAGKEGGTGAVRLVAIDKKTLIQTSEGTVDIFPESVLSKIGDSLFAVIKAADGKYYVGRFGADLKEAARTADAVNPFTFVVQGANGLVVQAAAGGFLTVDATSLATVSKLGL